jgi:hypothetical protein
MSKRHPRSPEAEVFLEQLREFYRFCHEPPYRELVKISQAVPGLYPDAGGGKRGLPALSASAISEILGGKRQNPPAAGWVATFVLCCQRWAWEVGVLAEDPGPKTLLIWQRRLWMARGTRAMSAGSNRDRSESLVGPTDDVACGTVLLTPIQQAYLASYGAYAKTLLADVETGIPSAVYRAAVLLGSDPAHGEDAESLLRWAAAAGHAPSAALLDANPVQLSPLDAVWHARQLASAAEDAGLADEALAYNDCVGRAGVLVAAIKVAVALLNQHGEHQAATSLTAALVQTCPRSSQGS